MDGRVVVLSIGALTASGTGAASVLGVQVAEEQDWILLVFAVDPTNLKSRGFNGA